MWDLSRTPNRSVREASQTTMHRWTARFLLLVTLVPVCGPLARARVAPPHAMHCMRMPVRRESAPQSSEPAMHCHHGMAKGEAMAPERETSQTSVRSLDCCCQNHDCCRGVKTSEWARPSSNLLSCLSLLIEAASAPRFVAHVSADPVGEDSTRAPPRS